MRGPFGHAITVSGHQIGGNIANQHYSNAPQGLKDWWCPRHGKFSGVQPICNELGCDSEGVVLYETQPLTELDKAKRWILHYPHKGYVPSEKFESEARNARVAKITLRRAREGLGIECVQMGRKWYVHLR
jgi:hypothetical protein